MSSPYRTSSTTNESLMHVRNLVILPVFGSTFAAISFTSIPVIPWSVFLASIAVTVAASSQLSSELPMISSILATDSMTCSILGFIQSYLSTELRYFIRPAYSRNIVLFRQPPFFFIQVGFIVHRIAYSSLWQDKHENSSIEG